MGSLQPPGLIKKFNLEKLECAIIGSVLLVLYYWFSIIKKNTVISTREKMLDQCFSFHDTCALAIQVLWPAHSPWPLFDVFIERHWL